MRNRFGLSRLRLFAVEILHFVQNDNPNKVCQFICANSLIYKTVFGSPLRRYAPPLPRGEALNFGRTGKALTGESCHRR